jgi:hypothetical protein
MVPPVKHISHRAISPRVLGALIDQINLRSKSNVKSCLTGLAYHATIVERLCQYRFQFGFVLFLAQPALLARRAGKRVLLNQREREVRELGLDQVKGLPLPSVVRELVVMLNQLWNLRGLGNSQNLLLSVVSLFEDINKLRLQAEAVD